MVSEELQDQPLYYVTDGLVKILHCTPPSLLQIRLVQLFAPTRNWTKVVPTIVTGKAVMSCYFSVHEFVLLKFTCLQVGYSERGVPSLLVTRRDELSENECTQQCNVGE